MICPNCGTDNEADARFCATCGRDLTADPVADTAALQPVAPAVGPAQPVAAAPAAPAIQSGPALRYAAGMALLTFVIALLLGQALAFLLYALNPGDLSTGDVLRLGGLFTYSFHHVGVRVSAPDFQFPQESGLPGGISVSVTVALALLLGTAILVWLLYRAGRGVGRRAGGNGWIRALHALGLAVPYAVVALAVSFAFRWHRVLPDSSFTPGGGSVTIQPSPVAALLWPLAIAVLAGCIGAYRSAPVEATGERPRADRWLRGAVAGGWRMVATGLMLAYAGFAVNAAVTPGLPREYFRSVVREDASYAVVNTFLVPNVAGLVLPFSMGSSLGIEGQAGSLSIASLTRFPDGLNLEGLDPTSAVGGSIPPDLIRTESLPPAYFLYLLVPLVAVLAGGVRASRRAGARSRVEGAGAGALAGAVFALLMALIVILAGVGIRASFSVTVFATEQSARVGASFWWTVLLAAAWGVLGGGLGGLLARPTAVPARPAEVPPPPPVPPPPVERPVPASERPTEQIPPPSERPTEQL